MHSLMCWWYFHKFNNSSVRNQLQMPWIFIKIGVHIVIFCWYIIKCSCCGFHKPKQKKKLQTFQQLRQQAFLEPLSRTSNKSSIKIKSTMHAQKKFFLVLLPHMPIVTFLNIPSKNDLWSKSISLFYHPFIRNAWSQFIVNVST